MLTAMAFIAGVMSATSVLVVFFLYLVAIGKSRRLEEEQKTQALSDDQTPDQPQETHGQWLN